jgi:hypothetical protein
MAVAVKNTIFRNVIQCSVVDVCRRSSETSVFFYYTTQHQLQEDSTLH